MEYEIFFLFAAVVLVLIDLILIGTAKSKSKRQNAVGLVAATLAFALVLASYALLLQAFILNDFQIIGVYSYSSSSASLL
jgi:cytochrome c biogenesis factor